MTYLQLIGYAAIPALGGTVWYLARQHRAKVPIEPLPVINLPEPSVEQASAPSREDWQAGKLTRQFSGFLSGWVLALILCTGLVLTVWLLLKASKPILVPEKQVSNYVAPITTPAPAKKVAAKSKKVQPKPPTIEVANVVANVVVTPVPVEALVTPVEPQPLSARELAYEERQRIFETKGLK